MPSEQRSGGTPQAEATQRRLVDTAEQLYAAQGLDGVSLAQINRAAGQRNATALHYHFGGKQGLIQAIFDKHTPRVNALRAELLRELAEDAPPEKLLGVLVIPLAEQVRDEDGGCCYLQFLAQVINSPTLAPESVDRRRDPVLDEQRLRFQRALAHLPPEVRSLRMEFVSAMVFNSLAAYARRVQADGFDRRRHQLVLQHLSHSAAGALQH